MRPIRYRDLGDVGCPIIVYTFGRSGTHMVIDMLRRQLRECMTWKYPGEHNDMLFASLDSLAAEGFETRRRSLARLRRCARPLLKTHEYDRSLAAVTKGHPELADWIRTTGQMVHIVRHPVHAIASWWRLQQSTLATNNSHFEVSPDEFVAYQAQRWTDQALLTSNMFRSFLTLRFEDLKRAPRACILAVGENLGMEPKLGEPMLAREFSSLSHSRRARLTAIRPTSSAIKLNSASRHPRCQFEWTPKRLETLICAASGVMSLYGYKIICGQAHINIDNLSKPKQFIIGFSA